jgi:predicted DNA-binding transcriptional regulator AlpA
VSTTLVWVEDLLGTAEIAELLNVSRQYVDRLSRRDPTFPGPLGRTTAGRIWRRDDIEAWAKETGRLQ